MQIGDNLHEMVNPDFWDLSSAEFGQRVVTFKFL